MKTPAQQANGSAMAIIPTTIEFLLSFIKKPGALMLIVHESDKGA